MKELQEELNQLGVEFIQERELSKYAEGSILGVEFDLDIDTELFKKLNEVVLLKKTKRETPFFLKFLTESDSTLTIAAFTYMPKVEGEILQYTQDKVIGNTFIDLCWLAGDGTTEATVEEVLTKKREGASWGDLSYVLPSKFIDDLIEVMHTVNPSLLGGMMQETIIYGPFKK